MKKRKTIFCVSSNPIILQLRISISLHKNWNINWNLRSIDMIGTNNQTHYLLVRLWMGIARLFELFMHVHGAPHYMKCFIIQVKLPYWWGWFMQITHTYINNKLWFWLCFEKHDWLSWLQQQEKKVNNELFFCYTRAIE